VILADPPWRFEPYSRDTGMDRAADNHYPTMTLDEICAVAVAGTIAADDCVLFLWTTLPMQRLAHTVMEAWGFDYRTGFVWVKDRIGTGYWNRSRHEVLLLGVRGHPVAPAPGTQPDSVIERPVGAHSAKPAVVHELVEAMFPSAAKIELFARRPRAGWDAWGLEAGPEA
jgi:N6-adenosine-specific RNA methylase IME4